MPPFGKGRCPSAHTGAEGSGSIAAQRHHIMKYDSTQIKHARDLRKNMTPEERKLWYEFLRTYPLRIMRQRPIDHYIVDFYCAAAKLVIELDGSQHFEPEGSKYDRERDHVLSTYGIKVLRIPNNEVNKNFYGVCEYINLVLKKRAGDGEGMGFDPSVMASREIGHDSSLSERELNMIL